MNEKINELITLMQQNPELEVIPATYYEVCAEDYGYWLGVINSIEIDFVYVGRERWVTGKEEIEELLIEEEFFEDEYDDMDEEEFDKMLEDKFNEFLSQGKVKKAIMVYITL